MALTVGELMVLVEADDTRMKSGLNDAETQARRAGERIGEGLADAAGDGAEAAGDSIATRLGDSLKAGLAGVGLAAGALLAAGMSQALEQGQIVAKLGAQLGATPAEAKKYGEIAGDLYADAITSDFQTAADAVKAVMKAGLAPPDATNKQIKSMATKAQDLASAFGEDVGGATRAVSQLLATGLASSAEEAFDLIAQGYQTSANKGEDFLDTINEYSVQFKRVGLDGQTAFGLIDQAMDKGARDSDQVADAIGQFGEKALAGGSAVEAAFESIGLDADDVAAKLKKGGKDGQAALQMTTDALRGTKDETTKLNAATALFGDPGTVMGDALFALDPASAAASSGMDKARGAAKNLGDGLRDNAAHSIAQFKQSFQQGLVEFLGNTVIPALMGFAGFLVDHKEELKAFATVITAVVVPALLLLGGKALWAGMQMARAWVLGLGPIGWIGLTIAGLVILIIAYWDDVKKYTLIAWDWVVGKLIWAKDGVLEAISFLGAVPGMVSDFFGDAKDYAVKKTLELLAWCSALPGRIGSAISGLGSLLWSRAGIAWQKFRDGTTRKVLSMISWVSGLPGRIASAIGDLNSLLYSKGMDIVFGLWNGIKSMRSWLKSTLMSWAKDLIPGPIAKALGINSPSKVMRDRIGRWIPAGVVEGIKGGYGAVRAAMTSLVPTPSLPALAPAGAGAAGAYGSPFAAQSTGGALVQIENWNAAEHGSPDDNARALEWLAKGRG
ncbi:phage tail tape measure protein [Streptomyces sp. NPDC059906]|uniref:phage tail tape measure protein n=1 Tax=Streptomyces sp. NPDC059906 TaxID=3346997 RepID=UPI003647746D